jgi:hypothetical protein
MLTLISRGDLNFGENTTIIIRKGKHAQLIPFKVVNITNGVYVDLFLFLRTHRTGGIISTIDAPFGGLECAGCAKGTAWTFPESRIYPLEKCPLGEKSYACPNDSQGWVESWYGSKWRDPPKKFITERPSVRKSSTTS